MIKTKFESKISKCHCIRTCAGRYTYWIEIRLKVNCVVFCYHRNSVECAIAEDWKVFHEFSNRNKISVSSWNWYRFHISYHLIYLPCAVHEWKKCSVIWHVLNVFHLYFIHYSGLQHKFEFSIDLSEIGIKWTRLKRKFFFWIHDKLRITSQVANWFSINKYWKLKLHFA